MAAYWNVPILYRWNHLLISRYRQQGLALGLRGFQRRLKESVDGCDSVFSGLRSGLRCPSGLTEGFNVVTALQTHVYPSDTLCVQHFSHVRQLSVFRTALAILTYEL